MGLGTLLERTVRGALRRAPSAALFRQADRYRNEGRYEEASRLVSQGLAQDPDSRVGYLLSAYLHVANRQTDRAKTDFKRVLALDPYHPRALLGMAKICLEEQDQEGAKALLNCALQYYADFAEAQALRDMVESWSQPSTSPSKARGSSPVDRVDAPAHDFVMMRPDGTTLHVRADGDHGGQLAQHAIQVVRMASATTSRAGLGTLQRGAIDTGAQTTFLLSDLDLIISATFGGTVEMEEGFAHVARLESELRKTGGPS